MEESLKKIALDWCKKEETRPSHSILLSMKLVATPTQTIALALTDCLPNIVGISRREDVGQDLTLVLCDFDKPVSFLKFGSEITLNFQPLPTSCRVIRLDDSPSHFPSKSSRVRISDLTKNGALDEWRNRPRPNSTESVPAIPSTSAGTSVSQPLPSDFSNSFSRCTLAANYRKLRCFSGLAVPSKDEDGYTAWIDHVEGQMDEWQDLDDAERRKRVREALRAPALSIINDLRRENPLATSRDYLKALDMAFGDTETNDELFVKFHSMTQRREEKPSQFLTRLQGTLRKALRRGIIPQDQSNRVRLTQFIRGITFDEMLLVNLHLRDKVDLPPTFLTLLSLVRKQEDEAKTKLAHRSQPAEHQGVHHLQHLSPHVPSFFPSAPHFFQHSAPLVPAPRHSMAHPRPQGERRGSGQRSYNAGAEDRGTLVNFCFGCGEQGHIRRRCPNPPNTEVVNQKLIKFILGERQSGNGSGRLPSGNQASNNQ
ncbi:paraneoplastic antigen Ma3-like [Patiria miniata]|uniref:CCHC-type domain-containing protein n=1 Tax=Patiria miniata TaxID=46514 RepID=A0A914A126_PATMI|nr:paraneoplastic antigen Ma3-like [Patiria miniata]